MSAEKEILYSAQGAVATITLNRPKRGNALTASMLSIFHSVLNQAINDKSIRVIVLTGNGKYFCTGMDLSISKDDDNSAASASSSSNISNSTSPTGSLFLTLNNCPKPTVARINGPALGGGVGLVFSCNFRIVHPSAYFQMPEVHRGLIPALISQVIVPQLGPFKSKQYMLSGERISAEEANRVGFITVVVDGNGGEDLDKKVQEYVSLLLQGGPGAMRDIKKLVDSVDNRGGNPSNVSAYVNQAFSDMMSSDEAAHGIGAFAMKQKPNWDDFGLGDDKYKSKL